MNRTANGAWVNMPKSLSVPIASDRDGWSRYYLMGRLKERYWIPNARSQVKVITRKYMRCKLLKHCVMHQQMRLLPATRSQINLRASVNVGDYMAGPVMVKIGGVANHNRSVGFACSLLCQLEQCIWSYSTGLDLDSFRNALTCFI